MTDPKGVIALDPWEALEVLAIDLDGDPLEALAFVQKQLAVQVKQALQPHWVPAFEVGSVQPFGGTR